MIQRSDRSDRLRSSKERFRDLSGRRAKGETPKLEGQHDDN
jgi:hypothetical protein